MFTTMEHSTHVLFPTRVLYFSLQIASYFSRLCKLNDDAHVSHEVADDQ